MEVLIIGGSRYFGRRLVQLLHTAGDQVTVLNRGSHTPPAGIGHLVADRDDEAAMRAALAGREFDVVLDQVCYTPRQAEISRRVVSGRVGRYVMTSTVEVYFPLQGAEPALVETLAEPSARPVEPDATAGDYGEGKRQAEAVFSRDPDFDYVPVRLAHVLGGGPADFTGRLAHYVSRIRGAEPVAVHRQPTPASFIRDVEAAEVLAWAAGATVTGPLNAASDGAYDVLTLCEAIGARVGREPRFHTVADDETASPFSFPASRPMDTTRAVRHGFTFSAVRQWLPDVIDEVS
ncbi:reductase [Actinoplanes sp. NEAU-A12]|uniref:Reductase n=1 Tax=Actinoplanes sandaracinus TaxID=3045177 RepID=A0ABT6WST0_9ACTN|nr:NAD-dependent epimerase/dehydratase family protein [Actinoplanes sandaracinus]MDI6102796.1 reductase [Actinoplanes sandaracinus]